MLAGRDPAPAAFEPAEVKDGCNERLEMALSPIRLLLSEDDPGDAEILQAARDLADSAELFLNAQINVLAFPDERDQARTNQETYEQARAEFERLAGDDTRTGGSGVPWGIIVLVLVSLTGVAGLGYLIWRLSSTSPELPPSEQPEQPHPQLTPQEQRAEQEPEEEPAE